MYAYSKKYNSDKVILIYPKINNEVINKNFYFEKGNRVMISFVDLENMKESIRKLRGKIL